MNWLYDEYSISAGDAAALWIGRGYNSRTGRFETLQASEMSPSRETKHRLRVVDLRLTDPTGVFRNGIFGLIYVVGDPLHTWQWSPVLQGVQSAHNLLTWSGDVPMLCGVAWRVHLGGLVANDVVKLRIGYECMG